MSHDNDAYLYQRQYAYDLLRRLFIEEPTPELLQFLKKDKFGFFPKNDSLTEINTAITGINSYLQEHTFKAGEETFENLHWDFTRMFIGPEAPQAPPWESVYVTKDKLLFQKTTNDVEDTYEQHGFALNPNEREAADHVGLELDFMYHLSTLSIKIFEGDIHTYSLEEIINVQHNFLSAHPLVFVPMFTKKMKDHAEIDFYKHIATLLESFLKYDDIKLCNLMNSSRN